MNDLSKTEIKWLDRLQKLLEKQPSKIKLVYIGGNSIKVEKNETSVNYFINTNAGSMDAGIN